MTNDEFEMRAILLDIDQELSDDERRKLCFLIPSEDVPRRLINAVVQKRSSMEEIWETLIDRQKISVNNLSYLVRRFEQLKRTDIADRLQRFCRVPLSSTTNPIQPSELNRKHQINENNLFRRIDPS